MARGKPHPTAVKQMVINILHHLSVTRTCEITGLKESTVQGILNELVMTGHIASPVKDNRKPRVHMLSSKHIQVVSTPFTFYPNSMLNPSPVSSRPIGSITNPATG